MGKDKKCNKCKKVTKIYHAIYFFFELVHFCKPCFLESYKFCTNKEFDEKKLELLEKL